MTGSPASAWQTSEIKANRRRYNDNQEAMEKIQRDYGKEGYISRGDIVRLDALELQGMRLLVLWDDNRLPHMPAGPHSLPQAGPGSNNRRGNLVAVCERCNRSKSNTPFAVWAQKCGILTSE